MPKIQDVRFKVKSKVQGIPCLLGVTEVGYYKEAYRGGHPDNWMPEDSSPHEYIVLDSKGYEAKWLLNKMDKSDENKHQLDIDKYLSESVYDY